MPPETNRDQSIIAPSDWWRVLPRRVYSKLQRLDSSQPWFEVYQINPSVFAFYEPGQFEEVISYLVLGEERAVLIDTGLGIGNIKNLAEEFTGSPITVVNTHSHYDHVAQNYLFGTVAIFDAANARQVSQNGYSKEQMAPLLADGMLSQPLPKDFDSKNYQVPPFRVTRWLKDGDAIDLGGRKLEIIHTPGHSPDSICLLERNSRLFWTGDMFYPGAIYLHLPGGDLNTFIESYEKMIALSSQYQTLLPSHNEPWVEKTALQEVLDAAQEVRGGTAQYVEGIEKNTRVRRYEYGQFSIITKAG